MQLFATSCGLRAAVKSNCEAICAINCNHSNKAQYVIKHCRNSTIKPVKLHGCVSWKGIKMSDFLECVQREEKNSFCISRTNSKNPSEPISLTMSPQGKEAVTTETMLVLISQCKNVTKADKVDWKQLDSFCRAVGQIHLSLLTLCCCCSYFFPF